MNEQHQRYAGCTGNREVVLSKQCDISEIHSTACKLRRTSREIMAFVNKLLEPVGVSQSQADFLYFLQQGETTPSVIAQAIGVDASNLSRMIRHFEENGWVERRVDESNRTRVEIRLTEEGKAFAKRVGKHADAVHETLDAELTDSDKEALNRVLGKIHDSMQRGPVHDWPAEPNEK
ncbi:MAG: MarR family transcriptional regulator [Phycisphaera sp.]|nr:MAG: MarR family transcriptional regulator [Phycisphaera sp.]